MAKYTSGLPVSLADLRERQRDNIHRRERLAALTERDRKALAKKKEEIDRKKAEMPPDIARQMSHRWDTEFADYKRELLAKSDKERWDLLRQIKADNDDVKEAIAFLGSPQQVLSAAGLNDAAETARRHQLHTMLQGAGDAALKTHAARAAATGDKVLASAIMQINDSRPRDSRFLDSAEFATALCGEESQLATLAQNEVTLCWERAMHDNQRLERGTTSTVATLSEGLAARAQNERMQKLTPEAQQEVTGEQEQA